MTFTNGGSPSPERYVQAALDSICSTIANTRHGRNAVINSESFCAGQLIRAGVVTRSEIERRLFDAAVASGYVGKDGANQAWASIKSGLDAGEREPRELPDAPRYSNGTNGHTNGVSARRPAPELGDVPLPEWTEPGPDNKPKLCAINKAEPPRFEGEVRRHVYLRNGEPVRVKVRQSAGQKFLNWYRVRRPSDGAIGWQARKLLGYVEVPFVPTGSKNPFAPERRGEIIAWAEGERDADALLASGFLSFTLGGTSDTECGDLLCGHHVLITEDNDEPGRLCTPKKVAAAIRSGAASIKVVRFPELEEGGDAALFFERGGTAEDLLDRAEQIDMAQWAKAEQPEEQPAPEPMPKTDGAPRIKATPFVWRDPKTFPRRRWLYGYHMIRKFSSATFAPGGVGKTTLLIGEALCIATGRNHLGVRLHEGPLRVWYLNLEDPAEEIDRRIVAVAMHFGIKPKDLDGRLFVDSGRETPVCVAVQDKQGAKIVEPVVEALTREIRERQIDVLVIDPFVSVHRVGESDNGAVDLVAKLFGKIADETNCSIELVHHVRKGQAGTTGGYTVEDGRGASALLSAVRSARVLNVMTGEEAEKAGVTQARRYFRVSNGKANLAPPPEASDWYHLASVTLGNGDDDTVGSLNDNSDTVAVAEPWQWPDAMVNVTVDHLRKVQRLVRDGEWREAVQAKSKWVGVCVAQAMGLDPDSKAHRVTITAALNSWFASGMLIKVRRQDGHREEKTFVEVGEWAND